MRITIKPYLTEYVSQIGSQLGIDDATEVVSILLLDHKRGVCRCLQSQTQPAAEMPTNIGTPLKDPNEALADGLEEFLSSSSY